METVTDSTREIAPRPSAKALKMDCQETLWTIQLAHNFSLGSMADLQNTLVHWLASGTALQFELASSQPNVALLQLVWAVEREAQRVGREITFLASAETQQAARNAGFEKLFGVTLAE